MIDIDLISKTSFILGGAAFSGEGGGYGFGTVDDMQVQGILERFIETEGICGIDLAPIYGFRKAEKLVGGLTKQNREKFFLTSKSGVSWHPSKRVNMSNCPKVTLRMFEASLQDLKTDYIDAYFIHWPDKKIDIRRPIEVLAKKKLRGELRYIGLCNSSFDDFQKASEVDDISIVQSEYNLFKNGFDKDLVDVAYQRKSTFWGWGTFDKGIISGRVTKDRSFGPHDCRSWAPWWKKSNKVEKIEVMQNIFSSCPHGKEDGTKLALYHANKSDPKISPIIGVKSISDLEKIFTDIKKLNDVDEAYYLALDKARSV